MPLNRRFFLFSMVELIIVMALLSMMMMMSVPLVSSIDNETIDTYVERISNLLENARAQAMTQGKAVSVRVDPDNRKIYGVSNVQKTSDVSKSYQTEESKAINDLTQVTIPEWLQIHIYSDRDHLTFKFFPDGTATIPCIKLNDAESEARYIMVMPLTGRVNVFDREPEYTIGSEVFRW